MNAREIIREVRRHRGKMWVEDGRLRVVARHPLPQPLQEEIRRNRDEVILHLTAPPMPPLPRSVAATCEYIARHKGKKDITPALHRWLDAEDDKIAAYEDAFERYNDHFRRRTLH